MRLEVTLKAQKPIDLPFHYNTHLRGFIYENLEASVAEDLHQNGYDSREKKYKMFTFSRLNGRSSVYYHKKKRQKRVVFDDTLSVQFSSIDAEDLKMGKDDKRAKADSLISLAQTLLTTREPVHLDGQACDVDGVNIKKPPSVDTAGPVRIRTLSPITLHKTFRYTDNSKGTHFYHPFDGLWQDKLFKNLLNKSEALGWERNLEALVDSYIRPLQLNRDDKAVMNDTGFWIEAWYGEYEVRLPDNLFWIAYKAGLGARNSAGFGMFEVI